MTVYRYREGYVPPKGVDASTAASAIAELKEPTPENMHEASKDSAHCLHKHLWSEGDQVWAYKARLHECRLFIGSVQREEVVGGTVVVNRTAVAVGHTWHHMTDVVANPDLHAGYIGEILKLQEQAAAKLRSFKTLLDACKTK